MNPGPRNVTAQFRSNWVIFLVLKKKVRIVSTFPADLRAIFNYIFPSQVEPGETCGVPEFPYPAGELSRFIASRRSVSPAVSATTSIENYYHKAVGLLSFTAPGMNKLPNIVHCPNCRHVRPNIINGHRAAVTCLHNENTKDI